MSKCSRCGNESTTGHACIDNSTVNFAKWRCSVCGGDVPIGIDHACPVSRYTLNVSKGWECPKCGTVYAPWVMKCDHCSEVK